MRHGSTLTLQAGAGYALFDEQFRLVAANPEFFPQDSAASERLEGITMLDVVSRVAADLQEMEALPSESSQIKAETLMRRWTDPTGAPLDVRTTGGAWKRLTCHQRPDGGMLIKELDRQHPALIKRTALGTGDTMGRKARQILESTAIPYLEKPIRPDALRAFVARLLADQ